MRNADDVIEIDLQELFGLLVHWVWLIVLCGAITATAGFCFSKFMIAPLYQSTTKVYILNKQSTGNITYSDVQLGTQLTKDYAQLIKSRDVLEEVIDTWELSDGYGEFSKRVTVQNISDTRIIAITVQDESPEMAQILANEIRSVAAEHIKQVMDIEAVNEAEGANLPTAPASPSIMKWTAIGGLIGIFTCAVVIVIRFLMDDTIKTGDDIERYLGLSTLAMIPIMEEVEKKKNTNKRRFVIQMPVRELESSNRDVHEMVSEEESKVEADNVEVIDMEQESEMQRAMSVQQESNVSKTVSMQQMELNVENGTETKPEVKVEIKNEKKSKGNGKSYGRKR